MLALKECNKRLVRQEWLDAVQADRQTGISPKRKIVLCAEEKKTGKTKKKAARNRGNKEERYPAIWFFLRMRGCKGRQVCALACWLFFALEVCRE
jgi:hypothetical protein